MDSLIFAFNATSPIIILVALGYVIKRIIKLDHSFIRLANKLVFKILLPCLLFLNIYNIDADSNIGAGYILYAVCAAGIVLICVFLTVHLITKDKPRQASLAQAYFRSNYALIGIPLAEALYGAEGAAIASLLSAFSIPLFNIFAVVCFNVYGKEKTRLKKVLLDIVKNPLTTSIAVGAIFLLIKNLCMQKGINADIRTLPFIYKPLNYLANASTPLALIVLGAQFEFSSVPGMKREIIFGTALRTVVVPAVALTVAYFMGVFGGAHFAAFIAFFASPVAVSSVPMAQEMGGDVELSGQLVVWSTLVSSVTIFIISFILRFIGVFA